MTINEHQISQDSNSASRLAYFSLAIVVGAIIFVMVPPISIPLSLLSLGLSRKAKALDNIDEVDRSVAKITFVLSIVAMVFSVLFILFMLSFLALNTGVETGPA